MRKEPRDVHAEITAQIVAQIEAGAGDFRMPWHQSSTGPLMLPRNVASQKFYRGVNIVSLWGTAHTRGYSSNVWGTYKQWQEAGAQVRKGERAALVMFFKEWHVEPDQSDASDDGKRLVARASVAFNADQVDGYQAPAAAAPAPDNGPIDRIAPADAFIKASNAVVRHGGNRAFYRRADDFIQMPDEKLFIDTHSTRTQNYYSTLLHELTHWSGAEKRLNREFGKRFGDEAYSFEELVAELGAAFLCASLGIENEPRQDHAQYIEHWLKIMKADKKALSHAAAKASAAADYLAGLAGEPAQAEAA